MSDLKNYCALTCRNPRLGETWACKGVGQEWSPKVTFHAPWSVIECEGMNLHIPKWACTLGVGVPMDSWILESNFKDKKLLDWRVAYIIENLLEHKCLKWVHMTHLGT